MKSVYIYPKVQGVTNNTVFVMSEDYDACHYKEYRITYRIPGSVKTGRILHTDLMLLLDDGIAKRKTVPGYFNDKEFIKIPINYLQHAE